MAAELLAPAPEGSMELYEVSPAVNRVANDAPALHSLQRRRCRASGGDAEAGTEEAADCGQRAGLVILIGRRYRSIADGQPRFTGFAALQTIAGDPLANHGRTDAGRTG